MEHAFHDVGAVDTLPPLNVNFRVEPLPGPDDRRAVAAREITVIDCAGVIGVGAGEGDRVGIGKVDCFGLISEGPVQNLLNCLI